MRAITHTLLSYIDGLYVAGIAEYGMPAYLCTLEFFLHVTSFFFRVGMGAEYIHVWPYPCVVNHAFE